MYFSHQIQQKQFSIINFKSRIWDLLFSTTGIKFNAFYFCYMITLKFDTYIYLLLFIYLIYQHIIFQTKQWLWHTLCPLGPWPIWYCLENSFWVVILFLFFPLWSFRFQTMITFAKLFNCPCMSRKPGRILLVYLSSYLNTSLKNISSVLYMVTSQAFCAREYL